MAIQKKISCKITCHICTNKKNFKKLALNGGIKQANFCRLELTVLQNPKKVPFVKVQKKTPKQKKDTKTKKGVKIHSFFLSNLAPSLHYMI